MPRLLFADGLGQYADATDMQRRFLAASGTLSGYTRASGAATKEILIGSNPVDIAVNPSTTTQGVVGARFRLASFTATYTILFQILEGSTAHLTVNVNTDGSITVKRGDDAGTTLGTTAAGIISTGTRYYVELKFTLHDSTGLVELRVNEVVVLTLTGQDTRNGGTPAWTVVRSWNRFGGAPFYAHDFHVADATGSHDYYGDLQTDPHYPTGAGNSTDGTPSAGSNYECVDDNPSNGDTDYVSVTNPGEKDTYVYEDLIPTGATIIAVTPVIDVMKVDAGTATLETVTRRGGTDYSSAAALAPSAGSYRYLSDLPMETDPSTAAAWTEANFNGAEFGSEKTA
jgi:hypothetical protein